MNLVKVVWGGWEDLTAFAFLDVYKLANGWTRFTPLDEACIFGVMV